MNYFGATPPVFRTSATREAQATRPTGARAEQTKNEGRPPMAPLAGRAPAHFLSH